MRSAAAAGCDMNGAWRAPPTRPGRWPSVRRATRRRRGGADRSISSGRWSLRIVIVALLCLCGAAILALHHVAADARRQNETAAEAVEKQLPVQIIRITRCLDRAERFPDWESTTSAHGVCAARRVLPGSGR